ncbi:hypothetical protein MPER_09538 [Moniliophthora perniciosa FA553]|nr:hypothetical protein MPER_09538 [Moniliophthora perniciosa FA553]
MPANRLPLTSTSCGIPITTIPSYLLSKDPNDPEAPPVPEELRQKVCIWGYELSDENFSAYESENFGPADFKYGPTGRRYSLMLDLTDQLGIRREPELSIFGDRYMHTRNLSKKDFIYWVIYYPGVEQELRVPTEEQRKALRERLKIERKEEWISIEA